MTSTRHVAHDTSGKIIGEWGVRNFVDLEKEKSTKRRNMHISRQALRAELLAQLGDNSQVQWGHCLQNISQNSDGKCELEFQVGEKREIHEADLVVGADGIRSSVRRI